VRAGAGYALLMGPSGVSAAAEAALLLSLGWQNAVLFSAMVLAALYPPALLALVFPAFVASPADEVCACEEAGGWAVLCASATRAGSGADAAGVGRAAGGMLPVLLLPTGLQSNEQCSNMCGSSDVAQGPAAQNWLWLSWCGVSRNSCRR
jgi:hypothetical protein